MSNLSQIHTNFSLKTNQKGFSLLELLVVLAIIGVVSIFTAPYLQSWNQRSSFDNSISAIKSIIYLAKSESSMQNTTVKIVISQNGDEYSFSTQQAASAISDCLDTTTWTVISSEQIELNSNFQIPSSGQNDICFYRDGTTGGGVINVNQKNSNTDIGTATISVTAATGFIDVIKN